MAHESDGVYYRWSYLWEQKKYGQIFRSIPFRSFTAYEDAPWWFPGFYEDIYEWFPDAKFILMQRDSDAWFRSLVSLKGGKTPGNTRRHCMIYDRMEEFNERLETDPSFIPSENQKDGLMRLDHMHDHYVKIYETYNRNVIDFFEKSSPDSLITTRLEDPDKWKVMGKFLGLQIDEEYDVHANKTG